VIIVSHKAKISQATPHKNIVTIMVRLQNLHFWMLTFLHIRHIIKMNIKGATAKQTVRRSCYFNQKSNLTLAGAVAFLMS
jgi:hypothetical protein